MVIFLKIVFFISLAAVVHNHIGYPLFMLFLKSISKKKHKVARLEEHPEVHILFAAYNEEKVIREKIERSFNCDYPIDKIRLTVGSDKSTDKTDSIVNELKEKYPGINLVVFNERQGKSSIINQLVKNVDSELLILTDANIMFGEETISELVQFIKGGKNVGAVGGNIEYLKVFEKGISEQEDFYLKMENAVKTAESRLFGTAMGLEGGCYIIKRELFPEIPPLFYMEDFYVSMSLMEKGYDVLFNDEAVCYEDVSVASTQEYKRKIRISIGNFQNLGRFKWLMFKKPFPLGFVFFSHKVLRWFTPIFLLLIFITSIFLTAEHQLFNIFTGIYFIFLAIGLFGILFSRSEYASWIKYPGHFIYMNLALLTGMFIYLKGVKTNVWQPTIRNQE